MHKPVKEQLTAAMQEAEDRYSRLVLLVGKTGSGKSKAMQNLANDFGQNALNINLVVSEKLIGLSPQKRGIRLQNILQDIVDEKSAPVLMDHTELLFDDSLQQDPLRLLLILSRNITIVAAWNGSTDLDGLTYAAPGHPEYRKYDSCDALIVNISDQCN